MKKTKCPACKYNFDTHSEINGETIKPREGDYSVCLNCGEILMFNGTELEPYIVYYDELKLDSKQIAQLMAAQIEIKLRGKFYEPTK